MKTFHIVDKKDGGDCITFDRIPIFAETEDDARREFAHWGINWLSKLDDEQGFAKRIVSDLLQSLEECSYYKSFSYDSHTYSIMEVNDDNE